jgi:hypothetical protein
MLGIDFKSGCIHLVLAHKAMWLRLDRREAANRRQTQAWGDALLSIGRGSKSRSSWPSGHVASDSESVSDGPCQTLFDVQNALGVDLQSVGPEQLFCRTENDIGRRCQRQTVAFYFVRRSWQIRATHVGIGRWIERLMLHVGRCPTCFSLSGALWTLDGWRRRTEGFCV